MLAILLVCIPLKMEAMYKSLSTEINGSNIQISNQFIDELEVKSASWPTIISKSDVSMLRSKKLCVDSLRNDNCLVEAKACSVLDGCADKSISLFVGSVYIDWEREGIDPTQYQKADDLPSSFLDRMDRFIQAGLTISPTFCFHSIGGNVTAQRLINQARNKAQLTHRGIETCLADYYLVTDSKGKTHRIPSDKDRATICNSSCVPMFLFSPNPFVIGDPFVGLHRTRGPAPNEPTNNLIGKVLHALGFRTETIGSDLKMAHYTCSIFEESLINSFSFRRCLSLLNRMEKHKSDLLVDDEYTIIRYYYYYATRKKSLSMNFVPAEEIISIKR